jgi:hypothetical protein
MRIFRTRVVRSGVAHTSASVSDNGTSSDVLNAAGGNLALARVVSTAAGQMTIVPGNGSVCMLAPGLGGCGAVSDMGQIGFAMVGKTADDPQGTQRLAGVVPDDVQSIEATLSDGTVVPIAIQNNAFATLLNGSVSTLTYQTTTGPVTQSFGASPDAIMKRWLPGQ